MTGVLILCGTPIGNLGDASARLAEALAGADVVFAEDTRRSRVLLDSMGVSKPMRSYFAGNEASRGHELAERLQAGEKVALITDAGMPAISDPGLSAVRVAEEVGATVPAVPGPSAVTMAVAVAGLPSDRFVFEGFLPRKGAERRRRLEGLAREERTVVIFVAPNRFATDLKDLARTLGPERPMAVTRELTKLHEEIWRGTIAQASDEWSSRSARGEFTLVIGGAPREEPSLEEAVRLARSLIDDGSSTADAARRSSDETGVARRLIYEAVHADDL